MLSKMLAIAAEAHKGQYDKAGKPYFLHCVKVAQLLHTEDEELLCIAIGHDLLEDTWVGEAYLLSAGVSARVVAGIRAMTKHEGQSYEQYKSQIKGNSDAVRVKLADLMHNMDLSRLKVVTDKDTARYEKYVAFYNELWELAR